MEDMFKLYVEKRKEYQNQISSDLNKIEESVLDLCEIGDYFSINKEDYMISVKAISQNDEKHIAIKTEDMTDFVSFKDLTLTDHPDLILWVIENKAIIEQGFKEVLINAVRNGENIINTLKALNINID